MSMDMNDKAILSCALTGVLTDPKQHPVPVTPAQMGKASPRAFLDTSPKHSISTPTARSYRNVSGQSGFARIFWRNVRDSVSGAVKCCLHRWAACLTTV